VQEDRRSFQRECYTLDRIALEYHAHIRIAPSLCQLIVMLLADVGKYELEIVIGSCYMLILKTKNAAALERRNGSLHFPARRSKWMNILHITSLKLA